MQLFWAQMGSDPIVKMSELAGWGARLEDPASLPLRRVEVQLPDIQPFRIRKPLPLARMKILDCQ